MRICSGCDGLGEEVTDGVAVGDGVGDAASEDVAVTVGVSVVVDDDDVGEMVAVGVSVAAIVAGCVAVAVGVPVAVGDGVDVAADTEVTVPLGDGAGETTVSAAADGPIVGSSCWAEERMVEEKADWSRSRIATKKNPPRFMTSPFLVVCS